jgi:hypothetical protein
VKQSQSKPSTSKKQDTSENTLPSFASKCGILSDLWFDYGDDEDFKDFMAYNDLGLPIAYAIHGEIVLPTDLAKQYVNETFDLFAKSLGLDPQGEWWNLEEMFESSLNLENE